MAKTKKKKTVERVLISGKPDFWQQLSDYLTSIKAGQRARSQFIRDAVREKIERDSE